MVTVVKVIRAIKIIFSLGDKAGETSAREVILEEKLNTFLNDWICWTAKIWPNYRRAAVKVQVPDVVTGSVQSGRCTVPLEEEVQQENPSIIVS